MNYNNSANIGNNFKYIVLGILIALFVFGVVNSTMTSDEYIVDSRNSEVYMGDYMTPDITEDYYEEQYRMYSQSNIFQVKNEMRETNYDSNMVQIGENLHYLGETISEWLDNGLVIMENYTVYDECVVLGIEGRPICRLYIYDDSGVMIEDAKIRAIYYGVLYDSSITDSNAKEELANPAPIACANGLYIGMDYTEVAGKLGDPTEIKDVRGSNIQQWTYLYDTHEFLVDVDRVTGKVCGIAYTLKIDMSQYVKW